MNFDWLLVYAHAVFGVLFLGNQIVTFVWKRSADRAGDLALSRFGARLVNFTDILFTAPTAALLLGSGLLLAYLREYPILQSHWLLGALVFFGLSGAVWAIVLIPNQIAQVKLLKNAASLEEVAEEHATLRNRWRIWGFVSSGFAFAAMLMMFLK